MLWSLECGSLTVTWLTSVVGQRPEPKPPVWALPSSHILRVPVLRPKELLYRDPGTSLSGQGRPEGNVGQALNEEGRAYGEHSSKRGVFTLCACAEALLFLLCCFLVRQGEQGL